MAVDLYGADASKLRGAYQKSLGRGASDDELTGWMSNQYGGGGVDDWVNQIGQSDEAQTYLRNNPQTPPQQDWLDAQPGVNQPYQPPATTPTAPSAPTQPGVTSADGTQQAVDRLRAAYQQHLGRPATDEEVNSWLAGTYGWGTGAGGVDAMIQGISTSGEAQAYAQSKGTQTTPTTPGAPPVDPNARRGPMGGEPAAQPTAPPPPAFQPPAPAPVSAPAAATPAPAAPAPGDGGVVTTPGFASGPILTQPSAPTTITDDVTKILRERLEQLRRPEDIQSDPAYQQAMKQYQIQQLRGADRQRAALAERMNAEGTLNSGGFNTGVQGIMERQAENEGSMASGLTLDRLQSREQQLLQAIALARSVGQDDIANQMEQERLKLSQELGRGDLALRQKLGTGDLELRSRLGLSDLELRRLLGQGQLELGRGDLALRGELGRGQLNLGYDNLGYNYADMVQRANRDAVLAAL